MINNNNKEIRHWSIISGISLLIMALVAGYAYGYVFGQIYEEGNIVSTLSNIQANYKLYLSGVIAWGIILITDVLVSYGFFTYLKSINRIDAFVSGLLRLAYSFVLAIGIVFLVNKDMEMFSRIWSFGLIIFGFHLIVTGKALFRKSGFLRILSVLLIIAGLGYSVINGLYNFLPSIDKFTTSLESFLMLPMTIGELLFGIWLLVKGGKTTNQQPLNEYAQVVE